MPACAGMTTFIVIFCWFNRPPIEPFILHKLKNSNILVQVATLNQPQKPFIFHLRHGVYPAYAG
jgi:hypothetical protein